MISQNYAPNTSSIARDFAVKARRQEQSKRKSSLLRIKFVTPNLLSCWRTIPKHLLVQQIKQQTNVADLWKVLFSISKELQWRQRSFHIQALIQQIHNRLLLEPQLQILTAITEFQVELQRLFCLKDKHILAHLTLLVQLLITVNKHQTILDETSLSVALLDLTGEPQINTRVMWMLSNMNVVGSICIRQIIKKQLYKSNQLPFLAIIANFATYANEECILQILDSEAVTSLLSQIFTHSFPSYAANREAHLFMNNVIGRKSGGFIKMMQDSHIMEMLLGQKSEQTWWTIYILAEAANHTSNDYLSKENCIALMESLQAGGLFNDPIKQLILSSYKSEAPDTQAIY